MDLLLEILKLAAEQKGWVDPETFNKFVQAVNAGFQVICNRLQYLTIQGLIQDVFLCWLAWMVYRQKKEIRQLKGISQRESAVKVG